MSGYLFICKKCGNAGQVELEQNLKDKTVTATCGRCKTRVTYDLVEKE